MQRVIRPDQDFRGYAGQWFRARFARAMASGAPLRPALSREEHRDIRRPLEEAVAPMSVTLTLEDEVDISRGDMLASAQKPPDAARQFDANIVWLNEQPLDLPGATC